MPTARELLERADALMRRNRAHVVDTDVPELTEVVPVPEALLPAAPVTQDDVPELTDAVEALAIASTAVRPADDGAEPADLLFDRAEPGFAVPPGAVAAAPALAAVVPPVADAAAPQADGPRAVADDWARWEALAEEIRMQVLHRIEIYTDTGLRTQLGARLQPIVDRASEELVTTINEQVGELLRSYIAEAIAREIEKSRKEGG